MKAVVKVTVKNSDEGARIIAGKIKAIRKGAKNAARKKAVYASYVRSHEKAYHTLEKIERNTLSSLRSNVERILAARGA